VKNHEACVTVDVDKRDYDKVCDLVRDWERGNGMMQNAVHCPQCGSPRIEYPQYTKKFVTPSFHLGLGIALGIIPKEFYCTECQYTWPSEMKADVERDILGWPKK
jgi:transposase-like protein